MIFDPPMDRSTPIDRAKRFVSAWVAHEQPFRRWPGYPASQGKSSSQILGETQRWYVRWVCHRQYSERLFVEVVEHCWDTQIPYADRLFAARLETL